MIGLNGYELLLPNRHQAFSLHPNQNIDLRRI